MDDVAIFEDTMKNKAGGSIMLKLEKFKVPH
jgi:hypothetical protein